MELKTLANPFQFTDLDVRTAVDEHADVWFCAKDVCLALDITWSGGSRTLSNMPIDWVRVVNFTTPQGRQDLYLINEPALYRLIFRSNKPKAEDFANWVCAEVLPQIRKHGFFGDVAPKDYIAIVKQIAQLEARLTDSKNAFTRQLLLKPLRNLCNMAGHSMPAVALLAQDVEQLDLFDEDGGHE